jgi:hypothetical protein
VSRRRAAANHIPKAREVHKRALPVRPREHSCASCAPQLPDAGALDTLPAALLVPFRGERVMRRRALSIRRFDRAMRALLCSIRALVAAHCERLWMMASWLAAMSRCHAVMGTLELSVEMGRIRSSIWLYLGRAPRGGERHRANRSKGKPDATRPGRQRRCPGRPDGSNFRVPSFADDDPAPDDARFRNLRAALAFLRLAPTEPELQLMHRRLDNWHGLGLLTVGIRAPGACGCRCRTSPRASGARR